MSFRLPYKKLAIGALVLLVAGFSAWHFLRPSDNYPGITYGNGRLESTEVDVATKVAGRIAEVLVREGDNMSAGQVVAQLDADDLAAQLRAAEASTVQASEAAKQARDAVMGAASQQKLARVSLDRTRQLVQKGFITGDSAASLTTAPIPAGVTRLGDDAFRECASLTQVTIPNRVTDLGRGAFAGCAG